jgi:hypothetical protein
MLDIHIAALLTLRAKRVMMKMGMELGPCHI